MRNLTTILGAALVAAGTISGMGGGIGAAHAQELIDGTNPESILEILKGFGSARVDVSSSTGNPKISGRADGKPYELFFYGCTDNKDCSSVQFWAYWDQEVPIEKVNEWNKNTRFGKLYIDQDQDLVMEFDVNLVYGINPRTLEDNTDVWVRLLAKVQDEVLAN